MPPVGINKLRDLIRLYYGDGVLTRYVESDVTIGTSAGQVVGPNPQRVALFVYNWGTAPVALGLSNAVTATTGVGIDTKQGLILDWLNDLALVGQAWFGISSGAGNAVHVIETLMVGEPIVGS